MGDVRECLGYENCKCRKRLVDKLVEECSEKWKDKRNSKWLWKCMWVLHNIHSIICYCFLVIIGVSSTFIHFHLYFKRINVGVNPGTVTIIY